MISRKSAVTFVHCCGGIAGIYAPGVFAQAGEVDICHFPPGSPENVLTITISEDALLPHLEHGDYLGACDTAGTKRTSSPACACPRAGVWTVTNLDGWMECNVLGIKRTLKGAGRNDGAIWILDDNCSTIFSEAYEKEREDVIMDRGRDCLFFGAAPGAEDGAKLILDGAYKIETAEFISSEYYMEMSAAGTNCNRYRPFEIEFQRPLSEKDYAKLEKKMQKEPEKARQTLEDHREQIDHYLEDTNDGKALGGRNGQQ